MDYVKPVDVASAMIETGRNKLKLSPVDLVIRGALAGSILAAATSLAITGAVQTNQLLVGALIFPVGLILIVLLGLDLVTGAFGLVPLPWMERDATAPSLLANFGWIFLGNLIGSIAYGGLLAIALQGLGLRARNACGARQQWNRKPRQPEIHAGDQVQGGHIVRKLAPDRRVAGLA